MMRNLLILTPSWEFLKHEENMLTTTKKLLLQVRMESFQDGLRLVLIVRVPVREQYPRAVFILRLVPFSVPQQLSITSLQNSILEFT